MPKFKIEFQRQWIERDTVERVIEADNPDHALQIAEGLATEYDSSCPDDVCGTKDGEASSWGVEYIVETDEPLTEEADNGEDPEDN